MGSDSEAEKSAHKEKKKVLALAPIAKPLAGKKLSKRALKLVRRGLYKPLSLSSLSLYIYTYEDIFLLFGFLNNFELGLFLSAAEQKCLKRGVKEVVKSIRRGNKGSVFVFSRFYFVYGIGLII